LLTAPELLSINPFDKNPVPSAVYQFPNATAAFGIAEVEPDVFAVATANLSVTFAFPPNNIALWVVDLRTETPKARKAVDLPQGAILNGLARLSSSKVLGSDIGAGLVYAIDIRTGETTIAIQDETMEAPPSLPGYGINGIRIHGGYLYYVNIGKGLFCRVPVHPITGTAVGPVAVISNAVGGPDDFALSKSGKKAYIANIFQHSLLKVTDGGKVEEIVRGSDGTLVGPTSAQLGRTSRDRDVLYVVDSGSVFNPQTSGFDSVEGGKVVSVKLHA
jgi:hypothetical protein